MLCIIFKLSCVVETDLKPHELCPFINFLMIHQTTKFVKILHDSLEKPLMIFIRN
jgi:hypothetical protein